MYLLCAQEQFNPPGCQPFEWVKCKQRVSAAPAVQLESSWRAAGEQLAELRSDRGAAKADRNTNICPAEVIRRSISIPPLLAGYEKWSSCFNPNL